jgi:hypothetical protein
MPAVDGPVPFLEHPADNAATAATRRPSVLALVRVAMSSSFEGHASGATAAPDVVLWKGAAVRSLSTLE